MRTCPRPFAPILLLLAATGHAQTPQLEWQGDLYGPSPSSWNAGVGCATDSQGDLYGIAQFHGPIDLDPGPGVVTCANTGGVDNVLFKLAPDRSFIWAVPLLGSNYTEVHDVEVDDLGDVYVVGGLDGPNDTVEVDPFGPGHVLHGSDGAGFLLKYAADGTFLYALQVPESRSVNGLVLLAGGGLCMVGDFGVTGPTVDLDPGPGVVVATGRRTFAITLDDQGQFVRGTSYGDATGIYTLKMDFVARDSADRVVLGGRLAGTLNANPEGTAAWLTNQPNWSSANTCTFLIHLDAQGQYEWGGTFTGGMNRPTAIACDGLGHTYIASSYNGPIDVDPGPGTVLCANVDSSYTDFCVVKLDEQGQLVWHHAFGGPSNDNAFALLPDANGFHLTGSSLGGTVDLDPGPGVVTMAPYWGFLARYQPNGDLVSAVPLTGTTDNVLRSLSPAPADGLYGVGYRGNAQGYAIWVTKWHSSPAGMATLHQVPSAVYPDPATDHLCVVLPVGAVVRGARIVSANGAVAMPAWRMDGRACTVDVAKLPSGRYQVQLVLDDTVSTASFIKL